MIDIHEIITNILNLVNVVTDTMITMMERNAQHVASYIFINGISLTNAMLNKVLILINGRK